MATEAQLQLRAQRAAQREARGYEPTKYSPVEPEKPRFLGRDIELNEDVLREKSFMGRVANDASLLAYAVPTGLAQIGVGLVTHPIETVKMVGGGLVQTGKDILGVTGVLGEETKRESINYYKAHPVMGLLDAFGVVSFGTGTLLKSSLTGTARSATLAATKAAAKAGVKSTAIDSALWTSRGLFNPVRWFRGAKKPTHPFYKSIEKVVRTGNADEVAETVARQFIQQGISEDVAVKIARTTADSVAKSIISQSRKLRVYDAITHPVSALSRGLRAPATKVSGALFGRPEMTAVGKIFGNDLVKANKKNAIGLERWIEAVVQEQGLENSLENRVRTLMDWKRQSDFANLTPEQLFKDFEKYVEADLKVRKLRELTNNNFVPVKALSKTATDAMVEDIKTNLPDIVDALKAEAGATEDVALNTVRVFDRLDELMTDVHGRDWEKYAPQIRKAYGDAGNEEALIKSVQALSEKRSTIAFEKWSPEARAIAADMERTGYRIAPAPTGKKISLAADILEAAEKSGRQIPLEAIDTQRTYLGKVLDRFGFSTGGVVEGANEFVFNQSFMQHAIKEIAERFGSTLKLKQPVSASVTSEAGFTRQVLKTKTVSVPVEKLYEYLRNHRNEAFRLRPLGEGLERLKQSEAFRPTSVFDLTVKDLKRLGFAEDVAIAIEKVSKKSLREIPASVTGVGEKLVNLLRASDNGFGVFGRFYDNFLKASFFMRYQSSLAVLFQAQQYVETKLMTAMLTKDARFIPGAELMANFGKNLIPARLQKRFKTIENLHQKLTIEPALNELDIVKTEILPNTQRALEDVISSPEFANFRRDVAEQGVGGTRKSALQVIGGGHREGIWMKVLGGWTVGQSAKISKAIAQKFGMTLEQATEFTIKNDVKIYTHPKIVREIQDTVQQVIHYKRGFQTSPLIKTLNIVWFPFRFQAKTVEVAGRWLGSLSPAQRLVVINNWVNFANWAGTDEGIEWRRKEQNAMYAFLSYTTAWEQIGDSLDAVSRGQLFGGNTGLVGGIPFSFITNTLQELALLPEDPQQIDPKTGRPFRFKKVPREITTEVAAMTFLEEFVATMIPGMPLYTLTGGVLKGVSWRHLWENAIEGAWGWVKATKAGVPAERGRDLLEREFIRMPFNVTR